MPEANAKTRARLHLPPAVPADVPTTISTSGCALRADPARLVAADTHLARLIMEIGAVVAAGQPVAVRFGAAPGDGATSTLTASLARVASALDTNGIARGDLEITLPASQPGLRDVCEYCVTEFRARRLNVCLGEADDGDAVDWDTLWQIASDRRVLVGCWPFVSSRSALLAAEAATDILPGHGLQAPPRSAWLLADLDFATAWETGNSLSEDAIQAILAGVFDGAEALHEAGRWPTPSMGHDAWFNRRMSIRLVGIGDWVRDQGLDPARHDTLTFLDRVIRSIARTFEQASRARASEPLPAVLAEDPGRLMPRGPQRDAWSARWREAIRRCGMRHRNLLTMSPWALFPRRDADLRYANLLPLLRHGDACSFAGDVPVGGWNGNDFRDFHLRILALARHALARNGVATSL